jgi:DNA repair exonuclease SbcCD ATPase subunit
MITLKTMKWSNLFSYGENNEIDFSKSPLTQILGYNGHGKSSIALILEEALYNKNSKGIKKADILNRNNNSKSYTIELDFDKDGDSYSLKTTRGSTQTVKLSRNGTDISGHTATTTYKTLEELIGFDHKTFTQIVYQSSAASLEFLTATDSNRKKFLIELLNLNKYIEYGEVFKGLLKETETEITKLNSKISTNKSWIDKYKSADLSLKQLLSVPVEPSKSLEEIAELKETVKNIESTNKKIIQNNKYKELRDSITVEVVPPKPVLDVTKLTTDKTENSKTVKDCDAFISKMKKLGHQCPTCTQEIDLEKVNDLIAEQESIKTASKATVENLEKLLQTYEKELKTWSTKEENKRLYEEYHALYDPGLETQILDRSELQKTIEVLEADVASIRKDIKKITEENNNILAHNARVNLLIGQLYDVQTSLEQDEELLSVLNERSSTLQLLVKTFSSTGLVAYKIECLVKDLESVTNTYLEELSNHRFQISFRVNSSDKLNVVISDHGKEIEISALSGGERARVNCAALLGIRKLMQSISNSRINLLILDETIENLDLDGKEKLVEVLLGEPHLNTFVISHGFNHPLLEKVTVKKKNNISRIEYGG